MARSLGEWVSGYPDRVKVSPESSEEVDFSVDLPEGEDKGRWGAFLVRPLGQEREEGRKGLNVGIKVQYAVTVYQKPTGREKSGQITGLRLRRREGKLLAQFRFRNTSGNFLRPEGEIRLRNKAGEITFKKSVESFLVLPHHRRKDTLRLDKPSSGNYTAMLILDYGVPERVGAIRKLQID